MVEKIHADNPIAAKRVGGMQNPAVVLPPGSEGRLFTR